MRRGIFTILAIAAVLWAPSPASAAGASGPAPFGLPSAAPDDSLGPTDPTFGPMAIGIGIGLGIGGIVAMALSAWLWPPARRRRRVDAEVPRPKDAAWASRATADDKVTAALHRRTLRRAGMRLEEDPIIASMGVGSPSRAENGTRPVRPPGRRLPPT